MKNKLSSRCGPLVLPRRAVTAMIAIILIAWAGYLFIHYADAAATKAPPTFRVTCAAMQAHHATSLEIPAQVPLPAGH